MPKTYVIGDIHGGLLALKDLLQKLDLQAKDQLIFLGDYVDGWSDSAHVVSYLIDIKEKLNCRFIKGNHDDLVLQWLTTDFNNEKWLQHGGESTKKTYENFDQATIDLHINFLENLENYIIDDQNRLFLHAGFANMNGPNYEFHQDTVYWDRTLWETAIALDPDLKKEDENYPKRLKLFKEIYIGHTPVTRLGSTKPINAINIWNIDTGAAFKGPLTAIEINSKEVFQSQPVYEYYPDEMGRN
ncbi:MAG: metallophosphoesterase [Flavobacteriaceae bacterium]